MIGMALEWEGRLGWGCAGVAIVIILFLFAIS